MGMFIVGKEKKKERKKKEKEKRRVVREKFQTKRSTLVKLLLTVLFLF